MLFLILCLQPSFRYLFTNYSLFCSVWCSPSLDPCLPIPCVELKMCWGFSADPRWLVAECFCNKPGDRQQWLIWLWLWERWKAVQLEGSLEVGLAGFADELGAHDSRNCNYSSIILFPKFYRLLLKFKRTILNSYLPLNTNFPTLPVLIQFILWRNTFEALITMYVPGTVLGIWVLYEQNRAYLFFFLDYALLEGDNK